MSESVVVSAKLPCVECGSSDGFHIYDDGHGHCFVCNFHPRDAANPTAGKEAKKVDSKFLTGEPQALTKRGLSEDTCKKWGYEVGEKSGKPVQIANYRNAEGKLVAQKVRFPNKDFIVVGDGKHMPLYGEHLWRDGGRMIVVTEGEIDALTVSQLQGNKWPVVSVPQGAQSAAKAIKRRLEWLEKFDTVVLMFDDDEPGQKAASECAPLFSPGRCKVARIPGFKDANEAHQAGQGKAVIDAMWGAKEWRPDGVIAASDLVDEASTPVPQGDPWLFDELTQWTFGRRPGEIYAFGAGTGVGKTDLFTQSIAFDVKRGRRVGAIYLEQAPVETVRRVAGKLAGKPLHIPGAVEQDELRSHIEALAKLDNLYLYNHFGATEWSLIKSRIRFMVVSLGCTHVYLDHLTALAANEEDEKKALDKIMAELAGQAQELGHMLHFVSHLATPEGKPHEEGGRVMIRHFRGSRSIGFWSHFMFGLERNQQAEDEEERSRSTLRVLKDRNTGRATGKTLTVTYDQESGLLIPPSGIAPDTEEKDF